ncbi:hypothetical protein K435DRAFT_634315, partial [Dendrothele bispora CBS 962.96]
QTSHRAELLGVLAGLRLIESLHLEDDEHDDEERAWIICTDSENVVKGITKYYATWKARNWRRVKSNARPADLDLFYNLDHQLREMKTKEISVGFWRIPREHNQLADKLA